MTRIPRFQLILVIMVAFVLTSVPFAGARPLETSQTAHRTESGWFANALKWLEELAGFVRSAADRGTGSPDAAQKGGNAPMGGSCIDPAGHPKPGCE